MGRVGTDRTALYCAVRKVDALHDYYVPMTVVSFRPRRRQQNQTTATTTTSVATNRFAPSNREKERKGQRRKGRSTGRKSERVIRLETRRDDGKGGGQRRKGQRDSAYAILRVYGGREPREGGGRDGGREEGDGQRKTAEVREIKREGKRQKERERERASDASDGCRVSRGCVDS